ncbi:MAG: hypothetical protein IJF16_03380 [Clostridia bacterium]|nr:hypothetical protein [Clostridia bacterium]
MARRICIDGCWSLEGLLGGDIDVAALKAQVPGFVSFDLIKAGILPDTEKDKHAYRLCEWIEHRRWRYKTRFDLPKEGKDGRSEKYYLSLPPVFGSGVLRINSNEIGFMKCSKPQRFDITAFVQESANELCVTFDAHRIEPHRRKEGFIAPIGLGRVELICVSFLNVLDISCKLSDHEAEVSVDAEAFVRGNYVYKFRLFAGDMLIASKNELVRLNACRQKVNTALPLLADLDKYVLMLSVERGGIRCDSDSLTIRRGPKELPFKIPLFIDSDSYDTARFSYDRWREYLMCAKSCGTSFVSVKKGAPRFSDGFYKAMEELDLFAVFDDEREGMMIPDKLNKDRCGIISKLKGTYTSVKVSNDELQAECAGISGRAVFEIRVYDTDGRELFFTHLSDTASGGYAQVSLRLPNKCIGSISCCIVSVWSGKERVSAGELLIKDIPSSDVGIKMYENRIVFENTCGFVRRIEHVPEDGIYDGRDFCLLMPYEKREAPLYRMDDRSNKNIKRPGYVEFA